MAYKIRKDIDYLSEEGINENIEFIKKADLKVSSKYVEKKGHYLTCVEAVFDNELRPFPADFFLDLTLMSHMKDINSERDTAKQAQKVFLARQDILGWITRFKGEIYNFTPQPEYGFSDIISQLNSLVEWVKIELEIDKHTLEMEKLSKENKYFKLPMIFSGLALVISLVSPVISDYLHYVFEKKHASTVNQTQSRPPLNQTDSLSH